jgi:hypothetical protein|tara:strand:- start:576 stop:992 length:417 start_codon:yes stop_codon:yes gene_type:complete
MKLVDNKNTTWRKISKVILIVNSVEISYRNSFSIDLNCNFENISRGRCNLKISKKLKKEIDSLYVHTDQPLMDVNIFYSSEKIERLINVLGMNKDNKRKIRAVLETSDNLMVNNNGYLYVKDKLELSIKSILWNIPII